MKKIISQLFMVLALLSTLTSSLLAYHCPTHLTPTRDGYWQSTQAPGWSSVVPLPQTTTVDSSQFKAAYFNPTQNFIACVYMSSQNEWLVIQSSRINHIKIDTGVVNQDNQKVWQWNNQHKDYSCAKPSASNTQQCRFMISTDMRHFNAPGASILDFFGERV